MDKLIVKGLGKPLDGEYPCDLLAMLSVGSADWLTNRESHKIKVMSGVRGGELLDAVFAGDNDVMVALAAIVLERNGKTVDEDRLWDLPMGTGVAFEIAEREVEESPPVEPAETPEPASTSGGASSGSTLDLKANGLSRIGPPDLVMSATSGQPTSGT